VRSNRRSLSPRSSNVSHGDRNNHPSTRDGFFGRRRSVSSEGSSSRGRTNDSIQSGASKNSGSFFGIGNRNAIGHDPTILAAKQKVADAEEAEREADRALTQAREMVKQAREHIKILEREATDDARRAKAKQAEAKLVSKTASSLGRHG